MTKTDKTIMVLGLGRFGQSVCERLVELGQHVIAVDIDKKALESVVSKVDLAAQLDVTDEDALDKIGAREVDIAVVAIGNNSEASIMVTALLHGFQVPYIVARADSVLMAKILAQVGARRVVFPAREMGQIVADRVVYANLHRFSHLQGEDLFVGEIGVSPEMVGKTLHEMDFRKTYHASVLMVEQKGRWILPRPNEPLEENSRLMIVGSPDDVDKLLDHVKEGQKQASNEKDLKNGKGAGTLERID